ncbi:AMP-binding protein [Knoellia aerolata]|uniref:Peptide permease n=1 Tax=Knoellia aerolata DSM 18566 TaxID=1385519 RepID=A0A0A0K258_9MICO|nr:AMP-binding protein [Knoellia aerolata]KGN43089.1 peptide permease [Knoellia aerolata DSM 18566]
MYTHLTDHLRWTLPQVLADQAVRHGDRVLVTVIGEGDLTYADAQRDAGRMANHLSASGVGVGDPVAVVLPNGLDFVRVWLALGRLGAVMVPVNTALTGDFLAHQLRDSGAQHVVVAGTAAAAVAEVLDAVPGLAPLSLAGWDLQPSRPGAETHDAAASDVACVMYTSGTTGPSKGVLMPHAHCYLFGLGSIEALGLTAEDRYYICMPFFHANGLFMQLYATLIAGATAVVRPRFSASAWLGDVRAHRCTVTNLLGAMSQFVQAQPAADDRDHALRVICPVPNPPTHEETWRERFGIADVVSAYGMTEVNIPLYGRLGRSRPGTAGLVLDRFFEVSIRHPDTDDALAPGEVGEIMVRPRIPFGFMAGYAGLPEATAEAWRSSWFHTGDSGTMDGDGWVTFVDRTKDCIRRRGENISSFEVEAAVTRLTGVAEVAAYAVPAGAEGTEDEVMLAVVAEPGSGLSAPEVAAHADRVLPRFAQPRYVELVTEIPRTPTEKVRKAELRRRGVTAATWDRLGDGGRS